MTAGVFTDLRKTFDTADHDILSGQHYGMRGLANDWFCSKLNGRKRFVSISNQVLAIKEIVSGAPQVSVLYPLLFLIYINDFHSCLKYSKAYCFADDTRITLSDSLQQILANRMSCNLRKLSMWLRANKLPRNVEKTELFVLRRINSKLNNSFKITLDGKRLIFSTSAKYRGVLLDENLTWSLQISHVRMKLN